MQQLVHLDCCHGSYDDEYHDQLIMRRATTSFLFLLGRYELLYEFMLQVRRASLCLDILGTLKPLYSEVRNGLQLSHRWVL